MITSQMVLAPCEPSLAGWLTDSLDPRQPGKGVPVAAVIPRRFDRYWRVLHVIFEDVEVEDRELTWDEAARNTVRVTPDPGSWDDLTSGATLVSGSPEEPFRGQRILWRELAERYGLQFHPEFTLQSLRSRFRRGSWPRYLVAPEEGSLDEESTQAIVDVLAPLTGEQFTYFWWDWLLDVSREKPLAYRGRLEDVLDLTSIDESLPTPTRWWPADESWTVYTDIDLQFSILAGPETLESRIADSGLEVVEVSPDSRIDDHADKVNRTASDGDI